MALDRIHERIPPMRKMRQRTIDEVQRRPKVEPHEAYHRCEDPKETDGVVAERLFAGATSITHITIHVREGNAVLEVLVNEMPTGMRISIAKGVTPIAQPIEVPSGSLVTLKLADGDWPIRGITVTYLYTVSP